MSWVEASGMTVGHVFDLSEGTVRAFWTYADHGAKTGGRIAELHTGTVTRL